MFSFIGLLFKQEEDEECRIFAAAKTKMMKLRAEKERELHMYVVTSQIINLTIKIADRVIKTCLGAF